MVLSRPVRIAVSILCAALVPLAAFAAPVVSAPSPAEKIDGTLARSLAEGQATDFVIRFSPQADLSPAYGMSWQARGQFVVEALRAVAEGSQKRAAAYLDGKGIAHHTFLAGNELYVWAGDLEVAQHLAALGEVEAVHAPESGTIDPVDPLGQAPPQPESTMAWGISDTKADQFWSTFDLKGDGIVVANIDTGVQWDHPALVNQFKCAGNPSDPACWADPTGECGASPCDNAGHGTHTMGTMVASDDPALAYTVGMAPRARWIACKACSASVCSGYALSVCADWMLAPGGDPANRPHVVNSSYTIGHGNNWLLPKFDAWKAAGIVPIAAAGNTGNCESVSSPGDYQSALGVAAHDAGRAIASFSSKGAGAYGDDPNTKPNLSAPGLYICSTVPTNGWSCAYSGTSMASPHVAGAVALLLSCQPSLIGQVDALFEALEAAAGPPPDGSCGAPPDGSGNYTYGYGYLDILQAGLERCAVPPTAVTVLWFTATPQADGMLTAWETASEIDILGYNLYRAESVDGARSQVNAELIPSQVPPGSPGGAVYSWLDGTARPGQMYYFWLEAVDAHGKSSLFGPAVGGGHTIFLPLILKK